MPVSSNPPCQLEACDLQSCLNKNTYTPDVCRDHMRKLYGCCDQFYSQDPKGDKAESSACPIPSAVKKWLEKDKE